MRLLLFLAAAALAAAPLAARGGAAKDRVKTTKREIEAIAMDGPLVAYDLSARYDSGCNKVYVWNVNTNGGAVVSGNETCEADGSSTGAGVTEIAVAGKQVAWITNEGGNTESGDYLYTSSLTKPKEKPLLSALRYGDVDGQLDGDWMGGLVGNSDVLAVGTWATDGGAVSKQKLRAIRGSGLRTVAQGSAAITPTAAGKAGLAVTRRDGTVGLYSPAGRLLRSFPTEAAGAAALTRRRLVVDTKRGLQVFDTATGRLLATWRSKVTPDSLDAEGDVAVYNGKCITSGTCGRSVFATRLSTGKTVKLATFAADVLRAQIEPAGVVYAYNTNNGGHIVLTPMARVEAALR
jgi:hypothetical protein